MLTATLSQPPVARAPRAVVTQVGVARRCYGVGQRVQVRGRGFSSDAPFDIAIDGVDFGQAVTSAQGGFSTSLLPGGIGAGQAQIVDRLRASDGTHQAQTSFTVTRPTGALFGAGVGGSVQRAVPFEVWDFAPTGSEVPVYLHYVAPTGRSIATVPLGRTGGQCGTLETAARPLFPFSPGPGTWTLQFDTAARFSTVPRGRRARLRVVIS